MIIAEVLSPAVLQAVQTNLKDVVLEIIDSGKRWPEVEPFIMNSQYAVMYAEEMFDGERWEAAEEIISKKPNLAFLYARDIIKGPWHEAEPYILRDPVWGERYTQEFYKNAEQEKRTAEIKQSADDLKKIQSFALTKNTITDKQLEKAKRLVKQIGGASVTLQTGEKVGDMFDDILSVYRRSSRIIPDFNPNVPSIRDFAEQLAIWTGGQYDIKNQAVVYASGSMRDDAVQFLLKKTGKEPSDNDIHVGRYVIRKHPRFDFKLLVMPSANIKNSNSITEGGWDSTVTQGTIIHPSTVKLVLVAVEHFVEDFNKWLSSQGIAEVKVGHPTGSSAYHDVDPEDKVYGDIDLQMIADPIDGSPSQFSAYYNRLVDQYISSVRPAGVHYEDKPATGHVIFKLGPETYVQVDMIWTTPNLSTWTRYRMTPERNIKGLITGNLYSSLGEIMGLAIQHSGVQMKIKNDQPVNYQRSRKEDRIDTLTTDITRFAYDLLLSLYRQQNGSGKPEISQRLLDHPGLNTNEVRISDLIQAIRGLAESFELNDMFGRGILAGFVDSDDFIEKFLTHYIGKAQAAADATKFDKATTAAAKERARDTKEKIAKGVELVVMMFRRAA